jgi:methylated-DNA-protein-cysteine methyltransferase-like protein
MAEFERAVVARLRQLRPGEVATYGEIAAEAGFPGAARAVGNVLARTDGLPWWRVVRADGSLPRTHEQEQARRLREEGVRVAGDRVAGARERGSARAGPPPAGVSEPPIT